ncbi:MAG: hypothetical protein ACPGTS_01045 [Minisyncoccia bacterium]
MSSITRVSIRNFINAEGEPCDIIKNIEEELEILKSNKKIIGEISFNSHIIYFDLNRNKITLLNYIFMDEKPGIYKINFFLSRLKMFVRKKKDV